MDNFIFGAKKVIPIVITSYVAGLTTEFIFAIIRKHTINEGFLVSGMLIPLVMPVDVPLWMVAVATIFAVVIGKEVFGGTGMNVLNPALTARAFLFFAYPTKMSGNEVWINTDLAQGQQVVDGFSGATPLGDAAAGLADKIPGILGIVYWHYTGLYRRDIYTGVFDRRCGAIIYRYRKLEDHAFRFHWRSCHVGDL